MDPSGPSQPGIDTAYNQKGNPSSKEPAENKIASEPNNAAEIDSRGPSDERVPSTNDSDARPSALGAGDTGDLVEKDIGQSKTQNFGPSDPNLEGEQMRAPGEGDVADAQSTERKEGMGIAGSQGDLAGDMDRKKEQHMEALKEEGKSLPRTAGGDEVPEEENWTGRKGNVNLSEALGNRGTAVVLAAEE